jgi:hypothetical protein
MPRFAVRRRWFRAGECDRASVIRALLIVSQVRQFMARIHLGFRRNLKGHHGY